MEPPDVDGGGLQSHNDTSIIRCNHHNNKSRQKKTKKIRQDKTSKGMGERYAIVRNMARVADAPCLSGSKRDGIKERSDPSSYR